MIYFKQYGEMRTGTNYLKRLLEINYDDVTVFGSLLGWKHGMYDLNNSRDGTGSHQEWLNKKTKNNIVYSVDDLPILKHTHDELMQAISELNYLYCIKKPVSYVLSIKKFRFPNRPLTQSNIVSLCDRYNTRYRDWLDMYMQHDGSFVSHESMLHDYKHVLLNLELKYQLNRKHNKLYNESKVVKASTDIGVIVDKKISFDADYYLKERYLEDISDDHVAIIEDNIDHDLVDTIYRLSL